IRQPVVELAGTLRLQLALLKHVHQRTGEVQDERRNSEEDQPDVHPDPGAAERPLDPGDGERSGRRRVDAEHEDDRQDERAEDLDAVLRSEEHTSELQSLAYLVCRLLLEKKNAS